MSCSFVGFPCSKPHGVCCLSRWERSGCTPPLMITKACSSGVGVRSRRSEPWYAELTAPGITPVHGRDVSRALSRPVSTPLERRNGLSGVERHPGAPALRWARWAIRMRPGIAPGVNTCMARDSKPDGGAFTRSGETRDVVCARRPGLLPDSPCRTTVRLCDVLDADSADVSRRALVVSVACGSLGLRFRGRRQVTRPCSPVKG